MTEPRPKIDDAMELEAARIVAEKIGKGATAEAIAEHYRFPMDGYELAKNLDRYEMWDVSRQEMEILDEMDVLVCRAERKAEKEWFERNQPQPTLPIGTKLKLRDGAGEITGVSTNSPAKYEVKMDGHDDGLSGWMRRLINFEDATPIEETA